MRTGGEPGQTRWIAARIAFVALLLATGFVAVSAQAVKLRVVQGAQLTRHGDDQWRRFVELRPRRGPITDRNGQTLAASADAPSVAASPHALSQLSRRELSRLARALAVDAGQLEKKAQRPTKFVWLKRRVSPEEAKAVQALDLEGVGLFQVVGGVKDCRAFRTQLAHEFENVRACLRVDTDAQYPANVVVFMKRGN